MVSLLAYVEASWRRVRGDLVLLALPVVGTVLHFENVLRVARAGAGGGAKFAFPTGFATLWTFTQVPSPSGFAVNPAAFVGGVLVHAALTAVYVPRAVARVRPGRGERGLGRALSRYFPPLFGVALVDVAVGLVLVAAALVAGPAVVVLVPVVLALGYALYAAPFLVVVADEGAVDALARSASLAADGGEYASYGLQYLVLVVAVSLVASSFVRLGLPAVAVAAVATAPLAAVTTAATGAFVTDLVDDDVGSAGRGDGTGRDGGTGRGDGTDRDAVGGLDGVEFARSTDDDAGGARGGWNDEERRDDDVGDERRDEEGRDGNGRDDDARERR